MRQTPSLAQVFSLLCFLGAAMLLLLEIIGPETQGSRRRFEESAANESAASPDESADEPDDGETGAIINSSNLTLEEFTVSWANNLQNLDRVLSESSQPQSSAEPTPEEQVAEGLYLQVSLSQRTLSVYQDQERQHQYPLAVGQEGWETPTGVFEVIETRKDPAWEHPLTGEVIPSGPTNPLGDRWIGFWTDGQVYIGFHGTADESDLGAAVSHGCLRLANADIRQLYELVEPGTPVIVRP